MQNKHQDSFIEIISRFYEYRLGSVRFIILFLKKKKLICSFIDQVSIFSL